MLPATRLRDLGLAIGIIVGGALLVRGGAGQRAVPPADETQRLRQANESMGKEYDLATGNAFYLLVDPSAAELTLTYRGAALRRFSILDSQVGLPRIAFINRGERPDWAGVIWSGGRLDPERPSDRVELTVPGPGAASEPASPPPPPEVAIPVPAAYFLRYEPGLVIEIERSGDDSNPGWRRLAARWQARGRDVLAALSPSERRLIRLRVVLTSADADSLYRSLPPDTKLLIVAPNASRNGTVVTPSAARGARRTS